MKLNVIHKKPEHQQLLLRKFETSNCHSKILFQKLRDKNIFKEIPTFRRKITY